MPISADLGSTLENYVTELVESGRYNSKSEVIREGVRMLQDRETQLRALDTAIERGLADIKAGRVEDAASVFDRLEAKYSAMVKA